MIKKFKLITIFMLIFSQLIFGDTTKTDKNEVEKKPVEKIIYLTFDDGPSENTDKILEILKKNNIKATFFVMGSNPNSERYKKIVDEGHTIALHTLTHKYKEVYASESSFFKDLYAIRDLVKSKTGVDSKITRFPGGSSTTKMSKALKASIIRRMNKEGYIYHDWNCDSGDARRNNVPAEEIIKNSTSCSQNKINLLMHDSHAKKSTVKALQSIIDHFRARGYNFEKMNEQSFKIQHVKSSRYN